MPTVIDPKTNEELKPENPSPVSNERELFAAEIAMEKGSNNFLPMLLIVALLVVVGGTVFYFVKGARDVLSPAAAKVTINGILKEQGPASIRFTAGAGAAGISEQLIEPQYKLLEKAGVIAIRKGKTGMDVAVTPNGEALLGMINGVQKSKSVTGNTKYLIPLAERTLVSVDKITLVKPHLAQVNYTWKWLPNRMGNEFDASGPLVKSFSTWDRSELIKSYGVAFYGAPPTKAAIVVIENDDGTWRPYTE